MVSTSNKSKRRYKGRTTDELRSERRERLLEAALSLFAERGYANTPIELICTTAKVTTRHFYEHFRNREAVLAALLDRIATQARQNILRGLARTGDEPIQRAIGALRSFVDYYLGDPRLARVGSVESVGVSAEMEQRRRAIIHELAGLIEAAADDLAAADVLAPRNFHLPAVALIGASNELIVEWCTTQTGLGAEELAREIVGIFRALIAGSHPPH